MRILIYIIIVAKEPLATIINFEEILLVLRAEEVLHNLNG